MLVEERLKVGVPAGESAARACRSPLSEINPSGPAYRQALVTATVIETGPRLAEERRDPNDEELFEIGRDNRKDPDPLEQRWSLSVACANTRSLNASQLTSRLMKSAGSASEGGGATSGLVGRCKQTSGTFHSRQQGRPAGNNDATRRAAGPPAAAVRMAPSQLGNVVTRCRPSSQTRAP